MKKRISILIVILGLISIQTQAQVKFSAHVGFGLQNINGKTADGSKLDNRAIPAYNLGAMVNFTIAPDFSIQTGLGFALKGARYTFTTPLIQRTKTIHLHYLELPVNFVYKPLVGKGHLLLGFGPYFAIGMRGKIITKETDAVNDVVFQNQVTPNSGVDAYFRPFESGANFLFGYEFFNHLQVQLNAQLGMTKINSKDASVPNDKTVMKNTGFGLALGWQF